MAFLDDRGRCGEVLCGGIQLLGQILADLRLLRGVGGFGSGDRFVAISCGPGRGRIMDTRSDRNGPIKNRVRLGFSV